MAKIALILADYNKEITNPLIESALSRAQALNHETKVYRVPGSYEIPLVAQLVLEQHQADGIVVLGYIERGETMHGEIMGHVTHSQLIRLQEKFKKPITFGIIGPGANFEQAKIRCQSYGIAAVDACDHMLKLVTQI